MTLTTVEIDLAKSVFQVHGVDEGGKTVLRKQLRRNQVLSFLVLQEGCLISVRGAHHWATARGTSERGYQRLDEQSERSGDSAGRNGRTRRDVTVSVLNPILDDADTSIGEVLLLGPAEIGYPVMLRCAGLRGPSSIGSPTQAPMFSPVRPAAPSASSSMS
jgi:hypothetical protein